MKIQGKIKKMMPIASGISRIGNSWKRQDFIFEFYDSINDQYTDTILLSIMNDRIDEINMYESQEVIIDVRHQVKTYGDRIYNEVWIKSFEPVTTTEQENSEHSDEKKDDMPF